MNCGTNPNFRDATVICVEAEFELTRIDHDEQKIYSNFYERKL